MKQGDTDADKSANRKKGGFSRRALLRGGGLLGAGAFAAGMAALSCSSGKPAAGGSGDGVSDNAGEESHDAALRGSSAVSSAQADGKLVPGDELAQDLLLILCPERLSCLVYEPSRYLVDQDIVSALPIYSELSSYLGDDSHGSRFELLKKKTLLGSDAVLNINMLGKGVDHSVAEKFAECLDVKCLIFDLELGGWTALLELIVQALGISVSGAVKSCFQMLDSLENVYGFLPSDERFRVLFCKGERGDIVFGEGTSLEICQEFAGCDYPALKKTREACFYIDTSEVYGGDFPADLVFLVSKKSFNTYRETALGTRKSNFSTWGSSDLGHTEDVLPAVIAGLDWICNFPVLLQCTLAAVWLGSYLYPDKTDADTSELLKAFEQWLCQPLLENRSCRTASDYLEKWSGQDVAHVREKKNKHKEHQQELYDEFEKKVEEAKHPSLDQIREAEEAGRKMAEEMERERKENWAEFQDVFEEGGE